MPYAVHLLSPLLVAVMLLQPGPPPSGRPVAWMDAPLAAVAAARDGRRPRPSPAFAAAEQARLEREAASVGARVVWSLDGCPPEPGRRPRTYGRYCTAEPDVIHINPHVRTFAADLRDGSTAATLRHELAHRAVWTACRTPTPPVAGGRGEALANAWAIRFYGADRDLLLEGRPAAYRPGPADFRAADAVHAGDCAGPA